MAETQADLFVNLDMTFTALSSIARPYLQETISESPPSEELAIREFPFQGKFLANNAAFFRELQPGHRDAAALGADPGGGVRRRHQDAAQDAPDQREAGRRLRDAWPTSPRTRSCARA